MPEQTTTEIEQVEPEVLKNPFDENNLLTSVQVEDLWRKKNEVVEEVPPVVEQKVEEVTPIVEEKKEEPQLTFANDESKRMYELLRDGKRDEIRAYLNELDTYTNLDKMKADEAIRLQLQKSNPDWTKEDIQDTMEEKYYVPEKPERDLIDDDDDYNRKLELWQVRADKVTRRLERDAREARQQLAGTVKDIVLPEIKTQNEPPPLSQEELAKIEGIRKEYLKQLDALGKDSLGFDARYKDEEVEIPVSFKIPDENKRELKQRLENFDLNSYMEQRYFTEKGIDAKKLMRDLYLLENMDYVLNGVATSAGTERFVAAEKARKNIKIDGNNNGNVALGLDDRMDRLAVKMFTS